jgi:methylglutaconyl-CoA hydratase
MVRSQYLSYATAPPIAYLKLQHHSADNALNYQMLEELHLSLQQAEQDESLKVIIISSEATSFCRGMEAAYLQQLQNFGVEENNADSNYMSQVLLAIKRHKKLIISQVKGLAEGEGCALAAASDFVLASPEARFSLPDAQYGNIPAVSIYFLLGRMLQGHLRHFLLHEYALSAGEAHARGLVDEVATDEWLQRWECSSLQEAAEAYAQWLSRINARGAIEFSKKMVQDLSIMPFNEGLNFAAKINAHARTTIEFKQGLQARIQGENMEW